MTNPNIDALNDVTKTLIDSQKGYQQACENCEDHPQLQQRFQRYAQERGQLVTEFQAKVREMGGDPVTSGGITGATHRVLTDFSSVFRDDSKAALAAIDDGEDHLVGEIESKLERDGLTADTRQLLSKAAQSAKEGERFADIMEEA